MSVSSHYRSLASTQLCDAIAMARNCDAMVNKIMQNTDISPEILCEMIDKTSSISEHRPSLSLEALQGLSIDGHNQWYYLMNYSFYSTIVDMLLRHDLYMRNESSIRYLRTLHEILMLANPNEKVMSDRTSEHVTRLIGDMNAHHMCCYTNIYGPDINLYVRTAEVLCRKYYSLLDTATYRIVEENIRSFLDRAKLYNSPLEPLLPITKSTTVGDYLKSLGFDISALY